MSLKTDFYDGATGLTQKCADAFSAGQSFVTSNLSAISADLKEQASFGVTKFTLNYVATFDAAILRGNKGNNLMLKSYLAGIQNGMANQAIYNYEVAPALNISDSATTTIDLNFTFQTQ
jgi:hypothetical protein